MRIGLLLLILTLIFSLPQIANGQKKSIWLGGGVAASASHISITTDLNFQLSTPLYLAAIANFHAPMNQLNRSYSYMDGTIGLGGGFIRKRGSWMLTASTGALLALDSRGKPETIVNHTTNSSVTYSTNRYGFALPLRLQMYLNSKIIGLGINAFYQFSTLENYGGVGLVIGVGRMR